MMTAKSTPIQTPLFVMGLTFGLISSLTGCMERGKYTSTKAATFTAIKA